MQDVNELKRNLALLDTDDLVDVLAAAREEVERRAEEAQRKAGELRERAEMLDRKSRRLTDALQASANQAGQHAETPAPGATGAAVAEACPEDEIAAIRSARHAGFARPEPVFPTLGTQRIPAAKRKTNKKRK